ncbi:MAG TPA: hypothetical protein VFK25_13195, partial [Candidatus Binatia bacterium]|nr:hypothetical protein [Candidatus Binatia bacterium]
GVTRPCFQSLSVGFDPHQSPIRIKAWRISQREFLPPLAVFLPRKLSRGAWGRVLNLDILTQARVLGGRARYVGLGNIAGP